MGGRRACGVRYACVRYYEPPVYSSSGSASTPTAIGPRAKISAIISVSPSTVPYSATDAFGYCVIAEHSTPKVEHVLHVFMAAVEAEQVVSTAEQNPIELSDEHAK